MHKGHYLEIFKSEINRAKEELFKYHKNYHLKDNEIFIAIQGNGRNRIKDLIIKNSNKYLIINSDNLENCSKWKSYENRNETYEQFAKRYKDELPIYIYAELKDELRDEIVGLLKLKRININWNKSLSYLFCKFIYVMYPIKKVRKYGLSSLVSNDNWYSPRVYCDLYICNL